MKKIIISICILVCFRVNIKAQYYNTALGLNGSMLKTALHDIIKNHNVQTWPLWSHFYNTDVAPSGKVWDMYSDIPGGTPPYTFILGTQQCGNYSQESDCYNHEHVWPQSYFNNNTPMRTDLHHVFPTDGYVNNKRADFPYGKVSNVTWTSQNGSLLGKSSDYAGYTGNVFEPIDSFKGDLARTIMYMSVRYEGEDAGWNNWAMANGAVITADAITVLLNWHHMDPVSKKEIDRNEAVYLIQNNRNPFIDYPLFADCIWGTADCTALSASDIVKNNKIQIYPNPCDGNRLLLQNLNTDVEYNSINIYSLAGTLLYNQKSNVFSEQIDVSQLTSGTYIISVKNEKNTSYSIWIKK